MMKSLEPYRIQGLVKKYSDYIRNSIKMDMTRSRMKEKPADAGDDYKPEWEEYTENETLNLWFRSEEVQEGAEGRGLQQLLYAEVLTIISRRCATSIPVWKAR